MSSGRLELKAEVYPGVARLRTADCLRHAEGGLANEPLSRQWRPDGVHMWLVSARSRGAIGVVKSVSRSWVICAGS
jgi:hypothetical protein